MAWGVGNLWGTYLSSLIKADNNIIDEHAIREGTFFIGGGGELGLFGCIVFSKVLTLPLGPAKEKHDPSQKIT